MKIDKMTITIAALVSGLVVGATPVMAAPSWAGGLGGTLNPTNQATRISNLQNRANNAIDARIANLNKLIEKINGITRLTSAQKSTLVSQIQTEISNLQALKTKIDSDTDLTTLRTDIQSIVQSFRVYVLFIPKIYIIAHADRLLDIVGLLQTLESKLQTRVSQVGNPSNLTVLLTDMTAKLTDATTQAQNAINAVLPLTPDGWPGNKVTLQSARTMLQAARMDLRGALHDVQAIRQGLRGFHGTPSVTPSVTPTVAPTATPTP